MTKRKKLAKKALDHPENFSYGELAYFQKWLDEHRHMKALRKKESKSTDDGGLQNRFPEL